MATNQYTKVPDEKSRTDSTNSQNSRYSQNSTETETEKVTCSRKVKRFFFGETLREGFLKGAYHAVALLSCVATSYLSYKTYEGGLFSGNCEPKNITFVPGMTCQQ